MPAIPDFYLFGLRSREISGVFNYNTRPMLNSPPSREAGVSIDWCINFDTTFFKGCLDIWWSKRPGFRVDFVTRLSYLAARPSLEPRLLQVFILFFCPTDWLTITRDGMMENEIFYGEGLKAWIPHRGFLFLFSRVLFESEKKRLELKGGWDQKRAPVLFHQTAVEPVHSSSLIIQPWLLPPRDVPS